MSDESDVILDLITTVEADLFEHVTEDHPAESLSVMKALSELHAEIESLRARLSAVEARQPINWWGTLLWYAPPITTTPTYQITNATGVDTTSTICLSNTTMPVVKDNRRPTHVVISTVEHSGDVNNSVVTEEVVE